MKKRLHIYYSGMVQGVGFRFTVERLSRHLDVAGSVRNLPDGRVELVAEGDEDVLADLMGKIKNGSLRNYIHNEDVSWQESTGEFKSFYVDI